MYFAGIAMALAVGSALLHSFVTTIYVLPITAPGEASVLTGIDAIQRVIESKGIVSYGLNLLPLLAMLYLCCWAAFLAVRAWGTGGSRLRLIASSAGAAIVFAILYCVFLQRVAMTDHLTGVEHVYGGIDGFAISVRAFGVGSAALQLTGYALLFFVPIILSVLVAHRFLGRSLRGADF